MKKFVLISFIAITALSALSACTDADKATRVLHGMGYKNVEVTGYRFFACGDDYTFHTGFKAKGADGSDVTGTVCSGVLKGSSVKID